MSQQKTNPVVFFSLMLILVLTALGLFKACNSCGRQDNDLNVTISYSETELKIINNTANTYDNVNIKLNNDYFKEVNSLEAYQTLIVPYTDFEKKDGTRLIPAFITLKSVYISAYYNNEKYWDYFTL